MVDSYIDFLTYKKKGENSHLRERKEYNDELTLAAVKTSSDFLVTNFFSTDTAMRVSRAGQ